MADETWEKVFEGFADASITLGPYYSYQLLNNPRHLLFVLARYKFAARMLPQSRQSDVLELGCGEGIGTLLLAEGGNRVTAVDFDSTAIERARSCYPESGINFKADDVLGGPFGEFDAVISLDVIEHIASEREDEYFNSVSRNLRPDGFCVIGTPNQSASQHASEASQIGHINLYTAERLAAATERYFKNVFVFGMNDEVLHTGFNAMSHYVFVIGSGKR